MPLLGVTMTETRFATVSKWMSKGSIKEFTEDILVDRLELVCSAFELFILPTIDNCAMVIGERCY